MDILSGNVFHLLQRIITVPSSMKYKFVIFLTTASCYCLALSSVCYGLLRKGFTPEMWKLSLELIQPPTPKPSGPNLYFQKMTLNNIADLSALRIHSNSFQFRETF